jgi:predicted acylesterase/phospholipase RssA
MLSVSRSWLRGGSTRAVSFLCDAGTREVAVPAHTRAENLAAIDELATKTTYPTTGLKPADVVMKGGITSGVVYPLAVCELAKQYEFRNVGGTSAGGIAAAFAAVAEYARDKGGFQRLATMPRDLGRGLGTMFQPSAGTRASFRVFRTATSRKAATLPKPVRVLGALFGSQPAGALVGAVLALAATVFSMMLVTHAPHSGHDWVGLLAHAWPAVPLVFVGAVAGAVAATMLGALKALPRNGHGFCIGSRGTGPRTEPLPFADWIGEQLSAVAGLDRVVLFGDLWGPDAVTRYWDAKPTDKERRERAMRRADPRVVLEMMTTNVTQARPVRLPFVEDVYCYCPEELGRWFTPDVMTALAAGGVATGDEDVPWRCPEHGSELRRLPHPPDLPVVVAVRMTLSFPLLISGVPLWVVDYGAQPPRPVHCRFSDGGISSNFPIHFFDALLPSRPTFAISLAPYPPGFETQHVRYTAKPKVHRAAPTDSLGQFLGAIFDTLQNWSDNGQAMLPGYRDRIVEVRTGPDEGGINLDMSDDTILDLAVRGRDAARALTDGKSGFDFAKHRTVRFRTALAELQEAVTTMATRYDSPLADGSPGYRAFVGALRGAGLGAGAVTRTDQLLTFVGRAATGTVTPPAPDLTRERPYPDPDLRVVPRF